MSEDKKGISLRKKREKQSKPGKNKDISVSAPRQISAPLPAGVTPASFQNSARPSTESNRSGRRLDAPRERPQRPDKTADLVKRRYSQKLQLPADFGNGELGALPQIPSQFRNPPSQSRDGRPPGGPDEVLRVDMKALRDPQLNHEKC